MQGVVQTDAVRLVLDERGNLQSLQNRHTGCEYLLAPGRDLWRLIRDADEDPETPILASGQENPRIATTPDSVEVLYPTLLDTTGQRLDITLTIVITAHGEELEFRATLANRSPWTVKEFWFPLIGGLGDLGADAARAMLLYPESAGRRVIDPRRRLADRNAQPVRGLTPHFIREFYPGRAAMQWLGYYGDSGSLYVGSHDRSLQTTAVQALLNVADEPARDSVSLGFIKYPFLPTGGTWQSAPFVVAVHSAGWHADARRYRAFVDGWQDHNRPKPDWVRDAPSMHDIVMLHQFGRVNVRYDQMGAVATAAATGGIDVLKFTGWSHGGHDNQYPDFAPSDRLGGEAALVENLRRLRQQGARVVLYLHFVQMSPNSRFYRLHGEFCALKGPNGNPFVDVFTWPSQGSILQMNERTQLINACTATEPWQEQVLACVRRALAWGVDSVFLDQTAGAPSSYLCFDARHGHPSPAFACGPGKTRLSERARDLVRAAGPDIALGAEYIADAILQYYDYTIPFGLGLFHGDQHFGELYRFTFPEDILFSQYISREDYAQLHYSFVMGFRFFLTPRQQCEAVTALEPAFVRRLAALNRLRRQHADVLLRGTFLETEPLRVTNPAIVARAYRAGNRSAVTVWNPTREPQPIEVTWPGLSLQSVARPESDRPAEAPDDVLGPDDVAVLFFGVPA